MVRIEGRYGRRAQAADMLELLGLKRTANLPKEGMAIREIQGVRVYVKASTSGGTRATRQCSHRVIAICTCGQHVPTGRLHQHKCKTDVCEHGYAHGTTCRGCDPDGGR